MFNIDTNAIKEHTQNISYIYIIHISISVYGLYFIVVN